MPVAPATTESTPGSLYQSILGEAFASLHPHVRCGHLAAFAAVGTADVEHGSSWLAALLVRLMHLPAAGRGRRVRLDVTTVGAEMEWNRRIGSSVLRTRQRAAGGLLLERNGMGEVAFKLEVDDGALLYRQIFMRVAGIVLPSSVSPRVSARVSPAADGWLVDVAVEWRSRLICRYVGVLTAAVP